MGRIIVLWNKSAFRVIYIFRCNNQSSTFPQNRGKKGSPPGKRAAGDDQSLAVRETRERLYHVGALVENNPDVCQSGLITNFIDDVFEEFCFQFVPVYFVFRRSEGPPGVDEKNGVRVPLNGYRYSERVILHTERPAIVVRVDLRVARLAQLIARAYVHSDDYRINTSVISVLIFYSLD